MAVTKDLYRDWKNHQVTQELMTELQQDCEQWVAKMIKRDRPDEAEDQFIRAVVKITDNVLSYAPTIVDESDLQEVEDVEA
jgi:hypothetical protein